jgi:ATP-dependent Clp protease ATP-binding subunit ClpA
MPEHLLLGLITASEGLRNGLFKHVSQPLHVSRHEVSVPSPTPIPTSVLIPNGEPTTRVFQGSAAEADRLHHTEIGLVHLLLGVMREKHSTAAGFLEKHGLWATAIRDAIATLRDERR